MDEVIDVAYGRGGWVAVNNGNPLLVYGNGFSWEAVAGVSGSHFNGIAYANGIWVAVGDSGQIVTSARADGPWTTPGTLPSVSESLRSVAYHAGSNTWVAVGADGRILTSTDPATTWTDRGQVTTSPFLRRVAVEPSGRWVATSLNDGQIFTTTTPTTIGTWIAVSMPSPTNVLLRGLTYSQDNSLWVAVGDLSNTSPRIYTATDPTGTWTSQSTTGITANKLFDVLFEQGQWVMASFGSNQGILTKTDITDSNSWTSVVTTNEGNTLRFYSIGYRS